MSNYQIKENSDFSEIDKDVNIVIITSEFNREETKALEDINEQYLRSKGFNNISKFLVPGAYEIPSFTKKVITKRKPDLVLTFGVVVRGDTPHFDYVCSQASKGIMELTVETDTPIIFGVLTCNTFEQVNERISANYSIAGLNLLSETYKI